MFRYLIRRLLWAIVLFFAVTVVTYVIFYAIPADLARLACGQRATPECVQRAAHFLGTDKPVYVQYGKFVKRLVWDRSLGRSFTNRQSVKYTIAHAAPVTASHVFGFKLGIFPITGYCDFFSPSGDCGGPVQWFYHLILPWCTFAILFAALYVRMIRANVMETLNEDYVRTARAKGAPEWLVMRSHILRNALLPVVTMLGMDIGAALGGAIFTESIFSLPGLGQTALDSIQLFDLPITQGIVIFG